MMKKNVLLHTNLLVCIVIIIGYLATAIISYRTNWDIFEKDVEQVSKLTMESISHQIDSNFTKPVNISLTMANDSLLKDFLEEEDEHLEDEVYIETMREYLEAYRAKYQYDSVFLVSAQTNRYYHFNGLDRVLTPDNEENVWYYSFLEEGEEYSLNIDNDEASKNEITVFINAKITNSDGNIIGIVGVGFQVDTLQKLLRKYEDEFDVKAYLVNRQGVIEISTDRTGYEGTALFADSSYASLKDNVLENSNDKLDLWYKGANGEGYLATQYIENLEWFLVIDHDTSDLSRQLIFQLIGSLGMLILVVAFVLFTIISIIRKYNQQVIRLTIAREQEHQAVFVKATEQMYENIYELDITHNCAASEATEQYFESLGVPKGTPYDEALCIIAEKQIKSEYQQGYVETFSREHVLEVYSQGTENLNYDFMTSADGLNYYWMRINAHIFTWQDDGSVRMLIYRQNIDAEKQREQFMLEKMQQDSLTGLYNKAAAQEHICRMLEDSSGKVAFFVLDIDEFKQVNDSYGHAAGDLVLIKFADALRAHFDKHDVVGRIGGDEFVAFMEVEDSDEAAGKAKELAGALCMYVETDSGMCGVTVSIGVTVASSTDIDFETLYKNADHALYQSKRNGKNGFTIFESTT